MMNLFMFNAFFSVYNYVVGTTDKICSTFQKIYRICTSSPVYYIMDNGQFTNSEMIVFNRDSQWSYDGMLLRHGISDQKPKKLPYMSCDFATDNVTVNMDDFIDETKFSASEQPPLPVVMAAFCIKTKTLYPWYNAQYTLFDRMGGEFKFSGSDGKFPDM
jgi:hypothetical protein